jgi:hypothetical protein
MDEANEHDLEEFLTAYIEAAIWCNEEDLKDGNGNAITEIAPEAVAFMREDCLAFLQHKLGGSLIAVAERLDAEGQWSLPGGVGCSILAYAGHDFWLTQNGHGCGFWDGDWPEGIGKGLAELSKSFGEVFLYIDDNGLINGGAM